MDSKKTTASGNFSNRQTSTTSKDAIDCQRADASMVQNILLVWLDNTIDEDNNDCRNTITQLRRVVNTINTLTDCDQCVDFLTDIDTEKVFMIISGELTPHIVPLIHDVTQLDSIYIFGENKTSHLEWAKEWPKIKGSFTKISTICEVLKEAFQQCKHHAIALGLMPTSIGASKTNLDCSFMYTQILKEILLTIQFKQQYISAFTGYCRDLNIYNDHELNNVNKLERTYREETPIWWYTYECFLYPMLNHSLRIMDVNMIIMMGFFVSDLSMIDFDQLVKTKGGLMSFNKFLSASKNRNISLSFTRKVISNPDITERIREETFPDSKGWYRLGLLLLRMRQPEKAQQVYKVMLQHTSDSCKKRNVYGPLGMTKTKQRQYEDTIIFYEKSLDIYQKTLPSTHPDLAASYNKR